jgi:hypothetical protein
MERSLHNHSHDHYSQTLYSQLVSDSAHRLRACTEQFEHDCINAAEPVSERLAVANNY